MVKHAENSYLNFMRNNPELFPWGSDDDDEDEDRSRSPPGLVMDPASSTTQEAQNFGDGSICYKLPTTSLLAGRVLHHCETVIQKLRMQTGGLQLVIFKIGITHECSRRFQLYKEKGWDRMVVMYQSDELGAIEMLEAALISQHCHLKQCRNVLRGGEGMRDNMFQPKFEPPYFCYCVSARADRPRWVV